LKNPTERVRIVGFERRDHGGKSACVLGELADGIGLRGELADSVLLEIRVGHDRFPPAKMFLMQVNGCKEQRRYIVARYTEAILANTFLHGIAT
jgi:hypothetical protein